MAKSKKALQDETLQGAAPAEGQVAVAATAEAQPVEAAAPEEEAPAEDPEPLHLIVCAYPGTEDLVKRIWEKFYDLPVRIVFFQEGQSLVHLLETVMVMEDVDKVFTVIPANLVPCAPVRWSELQTPRADDHGGDKLCFWGRVPVCFNKDVLVDFLPANDTLSDEEFVKAYITGIRRPDLVSHSYGNFFTKVLRATPCEAVVIEGLMRKRFIYANAAGWNAISDLLVQALL